MAEQKQPAKSEDQRQRETVEKLPAETDAGVERGERLATGKAISTGGQAAPPKKTTDDQ